MGGTILIVDDDRAVLNMLDKVMISNGFDTELCTSGEEAMEKIEQSSFDLLLLDINLKEMNGFEVTEKIREKGIDLPIIIISGRKENIDTVHGLDLGADDYITKPLNPVTLGAKVKALLRRSRGDLTESSNLINAGPFTYNMSTLKFFKNGVEIQLSSKENSIMKLFIDNVNHIFPKEIIYDMIWGHTLVGDTSIMVYINRLRQKIEEDPRNPMYIQTVRGVGYKFVV